MLVGDLPWIDHSHYIDNSPPDTNELYKGIESRQLPVPDYVSAGAADLLRRMLVVDPARRLDIFAVAAHEFLDDHVFADPEACAVLPMAKEEIAEACMAWVRSGRGAERLAA